MVPVQQHGGRSRAAREVAGPRKRAEDAQAGAGIGAAPQAVRVDPGELQQPRREHCGGRRVTRPVGGGRVVRDVVVPVGHAVAGQVGHRPVPGAPRRVQQPAVAGLAVGRREAIDRPGLAAGPGRAVVEPLDGAGPDRLAGRLVEAHDMGCAAVRPQVPRGGGERVLHGHVAPVRPAAEARGGEEQLEVHQVVDDHRHLTLRPVPAADRADLGHPPAGQRCSGPQDDGGVGGVAREPRAAPEAGLQEEAEVVGGGVVRPHPQRALPNSCPARPRPATGDLVRRPELPGVEAGQPARRTARAPAAAGRDGRVPTLREPALGAGQPGQREGRGLAEQHLGGCLPHRRLGRAGRQPVHRQHHRQREGDDRQQRRRGVVGPERSPVVGHLRRRYRPRHGGTVRTASTAPWSSHRRRRPRAPAASRPRSRARRRRARRAASRPGSGSTATS